MLFKGFSLDKERKNKFSLCIVLAYPYLCSMNRVKIIRTKWLLALLLWLPWLSVMAQQPKWNARYQAYIDQYRDIAIREMQRYGIPASITLAQGLLESGAGQSELARKGNNHFGIKCHGWDGRTVYHDDDERGECFRAYDSALGSYEDHSKFLSSSQRYRRLFDLGKTDYKGWARGLKACGYATNPRYAQQLIDIIELYGLHEYDKGKVPKNMGKVPVPESTKPETNVLPAHAISYYNGNYYLKARNGDTFKSLAVETGVSWRKLAKYNERNKRDVLSDGDLVYLKKKRTRADKKYKNAPHVVKAGESMYDIAQRYGIRLKSLYKKNGLTPDYQLRAGDRLKVY